MKASPLIMTAEKWKNLFQPKQRMRARGAASHKRTTMDWNMTLVLVAILAAACALTWLWPKKSKGKGASEAGNTPELLPVDDEAEGKQVSNIFEDRLRRGVSVFVLSRDGKMKDAHVLRLLEGEELLLSPKALGKHCSSVSLAHSVAFGGCLLPKLDYLVLLEIQPVVDRTVSVVSWRLAPTSEKDMSAQVLLAFLVKRIGAKQKEPGWKKPLLPLLRQRSLEVPIGLAISLQPFGGGLVRVGMAKWTSSSELPRRLVELVYRLPQSADSSDQEWRREVILECAEWYFCSSKFTRFYKAPQVLHRLNETESSLLRSEGNKSLGRSLMGCGTGNVWYCFYCKDSLDMSRVNLCHSTGEQKEKDLMFSYEDSVPQRHLNCPELTRFHWSGFSDEKACFQLTQRNIPLDQAVRDRSQAQVNEGGGRETNGIDILGKGIRVDETLPLLNRLKEQVVSLPVQKGSRKCLMPYSSKLYLPGWAKSDHIGIQQKDDLQFTDSHTYKNNTRRNAGLTATKKDLQLGFGQERQSVTSPGEAFHSCTVRHEICRVFWDFDIDSTSLTGDFKKKWRQGSPGFWRRASSSDLEEKYGTQYVKQMFLGGELKLTLSEHRGNSAKSTTKMGFTADLWDELIHAGLRNDVSEEIGKRKHDLSVESFGGKVITETLVKASFEDVRKAVQKWRESVDMLENLQPVRVITGTFAELLSE